MYGNHTFQTWCSTSTLTAVSFGLIWIQVFFRCFADSYKRDQSYVEIGQVFDLHIYLSPNAVKRFGNECL